MKTNRILVVTALQKERRALEAALGEDASRVALACLGMGPEKAGRRLRELLDRRRPDATVLFGSAGWLGAEEEFVAGRVFLISRAIFADPDAGENSWSAVAHERLWNFVAKNTNLPIAMAGTVERGVTDREARMRLSRTTGAELVDMETWAVYHLAEERGVPAIAVRVVTDAAGDAAKDEYKQNVDEALRRGAAVAARIVRGLLDKNDGPHLPPD